MATTTMQSYLSTRQIAELLGVSQTQARRLTKLPGFPPCHEISVRCPRWALTEVTDWADGQRRLPQLLPNSIPTHLLGARQEVTSRDDQRSDETDPHGAEFGSDIPDRNNDDLTGQGWIEPPRSDGQGAGNHVQLELLPEPGALTGEEQLEVHETLLCVSRFETESPLAVAQLRKSIDEWASAIECGDTLAAARSAVDAAHQLHRIALDADWLPDEEATNRVRAATKRWTFRVQGLLDPSHARDAR
jgi:predicted DNA-binding transcriptional regulator AlpA